MPSAHCEICDKRRTIARVSYPGLTVSMVDCVRHSVVCIRCLVEWLDVEPDIDWTGIPPKLPPPRPIRVESEYGVVIL